MLAARTPAAARLAARGAARRFATVVDAGGVRVAATDADAPTASVTLLVKAGSRFESKPGQAHALKNFAFKSTGKRSSLATIRETELYGGVLSSTLTREHLAITAEFLKGDEAYFVDLLTSFANSAKLTRYEFEESVMPCTEDETVAAHADPTTHALEAAHALAFRTGLGASLFAPSHADINVGDVQAFARAAFAKDNVAFLGTGLTEDALGSLVQGALGSLTGSASLPGTPTKYFGGETRVAAGGRGVQTAFVGFGVAGAPSPALAALAAHLSPSPAVKWGAGTGALVGAVPAGAALAPVYLPYSDGTLFGVLVQGARGALVRDAASAAVAAMRAAAELSADDAKKAVAKARFAAAAAVDARAGYVAELGPRLLAHGKGASALDALAAFDGLDASAVASAAQSLLKAKPTFVVVGDVNELPYADEVGL